MNYMRQAIACASILFALGVTGGCASFNAPQIQVQSVSVTETTDDALTIAFDLILTNRNDAPVELIEFEYNLEVDGRSVYSGRRDAQATVPAGGTWSLRVPAVIPFSDVGFSTSTMPEQVQYDVGGSLLYISPGALAEVLMDAGIYRPTTGFGAAGSLTLR